MYIYIYVCVRACTYRDVGTTADGFCLLAEAPALSEEAQETLAKAKARSKARKTERTQKLGPWMGNFWGF